MLACHIAKILAFCLEKRAWLSLLHGPKWTFLFKWLKRVQNGLFGSTTVQIDTKLFEMMQNGQKNRQKRVQNGPMWTTVKSGPKWS